MTKGDTVRVDCPTVRTSGIAILPSTFAATLVDLDDVWAVVRTRVGLITVQAYAVSPYEVIPDLRSADGT